MCAQIYKQWISLYSYICICTRTYNVSSNTHKIQIFLVEYWTLRETCSRERQIIVPSTTMTPIKIQTMNMVCMCVCIHACIYMHSFIHTYIPCSYHCLVLAATVGHASPWNRIFRRVWSLWQASCHASCTTLPNPDPNPIYSGIFQIIEF